MARKTILQIQDIDKIYQSENGEIEALKDINFNIQEGEFVSIIGPSGCGKSTLLSIIAGYPTQLSGGMRQRVALIRTLAIRPNILLLDEAFSALDYQTRLMVTEDIYKILKNENKTVLMVTHDISEAISMSDRVVVLSKRPATVKKIYNIEFNIDNRTPLNCRESSKFSEYFNLMWKELEQYDKT